MRETDEIYLFIYRELAVGVHAQTCNRSIQLTAPTDLLLLEGLESLLEA